MEREDIATFRAACHTPIMSSLHVYAQTRVVIIMKWTERRTPAPAPDQ